MDSRRPSRALVHRTYHGPIARAEAHYLSDVGGDSISVRGILGILRRHVGLILAVTLVAVGAAFYLVRREVPRYKAAAVIRLVDRRPAVIEGTAPSTATVVGKNADPLQSEIVVLTGRTVLGRAVDQEGLRIFHPSIGVPASFLEEVEVSLPPERSALIRLEFGRREVIVGSDGRYRREYGEPIVLDGARFVVPAPPGMKSATLAVRPRDMTIDYVMGGVQALSQGGTGGIDVQFTSTDPKVATKVVNAVVRAYQEVHIEMSGEHIRRRREFIEEQLRQTDSLIALAQAELSGLRSRELAYSAQSKFTAEQSNLTQVEIRQAELQSNLRMAEAMLDRISQPGSAGDLSAIMTVPGIGSDPVVNQLHAQLVAYRSERDGMLAGPWARAPTHPEVQRLETLIASTEQKLVQAVGSHVESLRGQVAALGRLKGRSIAEMSGLPSMEVQETGMIHDLAALQASGDQLRTLYQSVRLEQAAETGQVEIVQLATFAPRIPTNRTQKLLMALIAGLMLGTALAVLRERMDDSLNRPEDIEELLLVPNLAVIPRTTLQASKPSSTTDDEFGDKAARGNGAGQRIAAHPAAGAEAYRILRTNLLFSELGRGPKTLVITSATPEEGKTMTAVNLAIAYAQQGVRTLLMDCDYRRPTLGVLLGGVNGTDLTSVLRKKAKWWEAVRPSGIVDGLDVLLTDTARRDAPELLDESFMEHLLEEMARRYDVVIIDSSPVLVAADATVLGAMVDGVLLVVRAGEVDREAVQRAIRQLSMVGARVVGTVLNDPEGRVSRYGSAYDYVQDYD